MMAVIAKNLRKAFMLRGRRFSIRSLKSEAVDRGYAKAGPRDPKRCYAH